MRLRPNVALQQTGRLLMKRASRALLLIALQLNLGVKSHMRIFGISFGRPETKQPEGLISVLLDRSAPAGDRDDAAMDLYEYDEPEVEEALLSVVLDHADEEIVIESAGESLYQIWQRKGKHDASLVTSMHPSAQIFFNLKPRAHAT